MSWNTHIPKFRRFVLQNFPFIEEDFDALTDYALICKVVEYLNQVIDSQNGLISELETFETNLTNELNTFETNITNGFDQLTAVVNELQTFVENYFDNLDVQEEINHKLDEMAEDGTLEELISTQILGDLSNLKTNDKSSIVAAVNEVLMDQGAAIMDEYRKKYYSEWQLVTIPTAIDNSFFDNFLIYTNGGKDYIVDFDRDSFKNSSANTYYVSTTGDNTTGDGTSANPYRTLWKAYQQCSSGDTVIMKNGIYSRNGLLNADSTRLTKSLNIIGESVDGVWWKMADDHTWTPDSDYSNIYTTDRTGVRDVMDIRRRNSGDFVYLTKVNSKELCASTDNSWFYDSPHVYVNLGGVTVSDDNVVVTLGLGDKGILQAMDFTENAKIYIENINVLNGDRGGLNLNNNTNYDITVYLKNCKIYNVNSTDYGLDSISNRGCYTICENVVCNNTKKDGFNYHYSSTEKEAYGIEINCTSINCGYGQTDSGKLSNNATTAHNASQVIRVNGVYGFCNGGCAVDIDEVKSAFYGCTIFDSYGRSYDLYAGGTATMYVYDCYFKGSKAAENLKSNDTSYVYYNEGTEFDTKAGANVLPIPTE